MVEKESIRSCSLQCQAIHKIGSFIKRDHVIGSVMIGGDDRYGEDGVSHWQAMLRRCHKDVTMWHFLHF